MVYSGHMIEIKGWHGSLSSGRTKRNPLAVRLDEIAKPSLVHPDYVWSFDGTVGQFAERFQHNFMVLYHEGKPSIYITQYGSFNQR
jgi:hypothetical protein